MSAAAAGVPPAVRLAELEELEVTVERLVEGGEGLARFEGIPIFVPRSAPGDRARVRLVERRPDYGRAEIVELLTPGPGRRAAPCPYFTRCGGCDLQHLEDELQTRWKARAVVETLERLAGIAPPARLEIVAGEAWAYRLRTQLHVEARGERSAVGYRARRSHELVAVDRCPILVPELEGWLPQLPELLPAAAPKRLDLTVGGDGALSAAPVVAGLPHGEVAIAVGGSTYAYDARCFFQAHRGLLPALVERAVGELEGGTAFDLYCGVGLFTLPLGRRYQRVVGVEGDATAARYARTNARRNRLPNVEIVSRAVEGWVRELPSGASRVVVDPPRAGLSLTVRRLLLDRLPDRLTYVSCHAATLARDLGELKAAYRLESLALLDLFPQTGHMESVAQLERF
ncbi:MAG TPA: class I SAM-dependent RNA methyltransferase [Thermoanaerobaculia bacterium]|nr:class I SAM-dependent RNA methyltransferase [Thermoanaerobaculia bacterium]